MTTSSGNPDHLWPSPSRPPLAFRCVHFGRSGQKRACATALIDPSLLEYRNRNGLARVNRGKSRALAPQSAGCGPYFPLIRAAFASGTLLVDLPDLHRRPRATEAAKTFLTSRVGEYDVPEVIHTHQLRSYGAAIREDPRGGNVDHQQVISTAHMAPRTKNAANWDFGMSNGRKDPSTSTPP